MKEEVAPGVWLGTRGYEIHRDGEVYTVPQIAEYLEMERSGVMKRIRRYRAGGVDFESIFADPDSDMVRAQPDRPTGPMQVELGRQSHHDIDPLWRRALCSPWGRVNAHPQL